MPMSKFSAILSFSLATLLAFTLQIFIFSPISPVPLQIPAAVSSTFPPTSYDLQRVVKLGEGLLEKPEDVCFDKEGMLYTATRDGWIKRMHKNGSWEDWKRIGGDALLGITPTITGGVLVCDAEKGLFKVSDDGITLVASHVNGSKIRYADDVIEASDGTVYFSVASTKYGLQDTDLDLLEARPHGQLLKYDPISQETSILIDGLLFANGVALSKDEDFLVVCETWRCRCKKHWLKGKNKGETEVFVDNLPGGPDNINLAPDGSFWIALVKLTSDGLEFIHTSTTLKRLFASYPSLFPNFTGMNKKATAVNVAADGRIIRKLDDPNGTVISFVTSALEYEDHLYLGNLNTNFVGKLALKKE
ncbi:hypothetical protein RJ641_026658 [Dillenia turbinata]|uniref:Strictosidine synthase conserved region domain-containing protein n=1 Tax=Dillenia turbinata TaxID=194707 RepID=A0AAN8ZKK2_9MAGN